MGILADDAAEKNADRKSWIVWHRRRTWTARWVTTARRSAEALCDWLKAHPEVEIISRDRGDEYIRGATAGAPQATQVADRWHLLRNLRDALMGTIDRHHAEVRATAEEVAANLPDRTPGAEARQPEPTPKPVTSCSGPRAERQQARRARRLQHYEQVLALHEEGLSQRAIADRLGMHRDTVHRYLEAETFPERAGRHYSRRVHRFVDYLRQRWADGCRNATQLFAEITAQGFDGSCYMVRRQLARWRKADPQSEPGQGRKSPGPAVIERPSARRVSWLLLRDDADLEPEEKVFRARLQERCPELRAAAELAREFRSLVRARRVEGWDAWLARATVLIAVKELRTFAEGLKKDESAVRAALQLEWSNGQVEGHVNRLKLIKRSMFGRAKFDLLRQRVLLAS